MTFAPVGSWTWLLVIGAVVVILRVFALSRILAQPPSTRRRHTLWRWTGLTFAVVFVMVAAARPGLATGREVSLAVDAPGSANVTVFFVVDRSADSPVQVMRADLTALIDQYPGARFALISFATRATMDWPVSEDVSGLRSVVSGLSTYVATTPEQALQTNAFAARDVLRAGAEQAAAQYPGSRNLVFYLGTGDPASAVSRGTFETPTDGGAVLGYGTVDQPRLQEIADQLAVPYILRQPGQALGEVVPPVEVADGTSGESLQVADRRELYWLFTLLAAALILGEIALTLREYHKNRLSRREMKG
ncbi:MAG: VWA domain-containing protein [Mycobacterium sp.]